ncbi:glycosyltransferase family 2 protein, partial [Candidatus Woesearchaeota archaeon]|nr:glycosyltransferase family 2 protein [Candidatus Woesearchaeota archaeon]
MYTAKDISIVIPSYQRAEEVKRTLKEMKKLYPQPREILVVDQSTTENTKKVCNQSKMKNVKYVFSSPPSITIARNVGVKASHKDAKIIVFIDDDVSLDKKYIERIVEVYNKYPGAKGVSGFHCEDEVKNLPFVKKTAFYMERFLRRIFFLGRLEKDQ